ncbi:SRPBCC family protein [Nakamurella sp. A5-74]|uniref:SRPBCC family protein n=1 Tax=Nakamurella sp. A5-74 TaxID=3158264 RepID=A0AAU8DPB6_9ACTN
MTDTVQRDTEITAVEDLPVIRMVRDFDASPEQLLLAHTDPELFVRWIGPDSITTTLDSWDCRTGGSWAYTSRRDDLTISFFGSFHEIRPDRLVQTFTWDGNADQVSLETMTFQTIGDGRTRLEATSLHGSFAARDGMLSSGMDVGVNEGYRKLDALLAGGSR